MRSIALILALIVSTQAVAEDARYAGRWGLDGQCNEDGASDAPWTVLNLTKDTMKGYEYACRFTKVTPTTIVDQWKVEADCVNEGEAYKDAMSLEMTSNRLALMVIRPDNIVVYNRCDETP